MANCLKPEAPASEGGRYNSLAEAFATIGKKRSTQRRKWGRRRAPSRAGEFDSCADLREMLVPAGGAGDQTDAKLGEASKVSSAVEFTTPAAAPCGAGEGFERKATRCWHS